MFLALKKVMAMKNKTKFVWILIITLILIIVGYAHYYPIKHDTIDLRHIVRDRLGEDLVKFTSIGLNNKDFYYFVVSEYKIVVVKMKRGEFNRFRYQGMSYTGANFVNGVVESKGNKYLLVGGKNPNHEIEKISFTLDNSSYVIDLVNPGDVFFEYIQIDNKTFDNHIFLDNTILYNGNGEDITANIDISSGGIL